MSTMWSNSKNRCLPSFSFCLFWEKKGTPWEKKWLMQQRHVPAVSNRARRSWVGIRAVREREIDGGDGVRTFPTGASLPFFPWFSVGSHQRWPASDLRAVREPSSDAPPVGTIFSGLIFLLGTMGMLFYTEQPTQWCMGAKPLHKPHGTKCMER